MSDLIDEAIAQLKDTDAGWVTRRDAAERMGKVAAKAVTGLLEHARDPDQDVRGTVRQALGWASSGLRGIKPVPLERAYSLRELVEGCERPPKRVAAEHGDGFEIVVQGKDGRSQSVIIMPFQRGDGVELIRVFTRCGKPTDDLWRWALETNMSLTSGAIALTEDEGELMLVITKCFIASEVTPEEVKAAVKELAFYGDWIEARIGEADVH